MKPIFELASNILLWILLPLILIVYCIALIILFAGHAFAYIFDWAEKKRIRIIHKILFPLTKR